MNLNDLRRGLAEEPVPDPLDPELLVRMAQVRGRRKGRSRTVLVVGAVAAVVALGLVGAVSSGWFGTRTSVAGMPSAVPTQTASAMPDGSPQPSGAPQPSGSATSQPVARVTVPASGPAPAVPVLAVDPAPAVRTIPDDTWVEVSPDLWLATWQTKWVLWEGAKPTMTPGVACTTGAGTTPFGCRGTIHNSNIDASFSNVQVSGSGDRMVATSVFKGSPASAKATALDGTSYWGVCWRLAGVPGWTFAEWITPSTPPESATPPAGYPYLTPTYTIYDAAGTVIGRFPN